MVTLTADYVPGTGINKSDETGSYTLNNVPCGCRVYTDETHTFEGVARTAEIERNPLAVTAEDGVTSQKYTVSVSVSDDDTEVVKAQNEAAVAAVTGRKKTTGGILSRMSEAMKKGNYVRDE